MDHWSVDSSYARNWYTNKWTLVIQLFKPLSIWLEQPFTQAAWTFDYVYRFRNLCHQCLREIPLTLDYGKYKQNWSRQKIIRKRAIQVIRRIVRTLLLLWTQWIIIQVIERYERNSFFSVEISWITRITDLSVQTNRPLMSIILILR